MTRSRKSVLSALSADATSLAALHRDTTFAFVDFCLLVPSKDLDSLVWTPLLLQARRAIELLNQSAVQAAQLSLEDAAVSTTSAQDDIACEALDCIATWAREVLEADKKAVAPANLFETLVLMHANLYNDILCAQPNTPAMLSIVRACECWWTQQREGREQLVTHALMFLLLRSVEPTSKAADIKRVYNFRDAFALFDFDDDDSVHVRTLLARAFIHPQYVNYGSGSDSSNDAPASFGNRFLSFALCLHAPLVDVLLAAMREQLPNARPPALRGYAEALLRAWVQSDGQVRLRLEQAGIQALLRTACYGTHSTVKAARSLLRHWCGRRRLKGVDEMLTRLLQPLLWRGLKAANPTARFQCAQVLFEAFPVQNTDSGRAEQDAALQMQFDAMLELLNDAEVRVRALAVEGCCRVVAQYWSLLPAQAARAPLLQRIFALAADAASATVRCAVCAGVTYLMASQPAAVAVLRPLLPALSPLLMDSSMAVRLAHAQLLLSLRASAGSVLRFTDACALDTILQALASAPPASELARRLSLLLLPSFAPGESDQADNTTTTSTTEPVRQYTPAERLVRLLTLIRKSPTAARVLCANVARLSGAHRAASLLAIVFNALVMHLDLEANAEHDKPVEPVPAKRGRKGAAAAEPEVVSKPVAGDAVFSLSDSAVVGGAFACITALWRSLPDDNDSQDDVDVGVDSVAKGVDDEGRWRARLMSTLAAGSANSSTGLTRLLHRFAGDSTATSALLALAARLPTKCVPQLAKEVVTSLSKVLPNAAAVAFVPLLECACAWGESQAVLDLIQSSLDAGFDSKTGQMHPITAARLLGSLLSNARTRSLLADQSDRVTALIHHAMSRAQSALERSIDTSIDVNVLAVALSSMEMSARASIQLIASSTASDKSVPEAIKRLSVWISHTLVPVLPRSGTLLINHDDEKNKRAKKPAAAAVEGLKAEALFRVLILLARVSADCIALELHGTAMLVQTLSDLVISLDTANQSPKQIEFASEFAQTTAGALVHLAAADRPFVPVHEVETLLSSIVKHAPAAALTQTQMLNSLSATLAAYTHTDASTAKCRALPDIVAACLRPVIALEIRSSTELSAAAGESDVNEITFPARSALVLNALLRSPACANALPTAITLLLRAIETDSLGALVHVLSDATALAPTIVKNATKRAAFVAVLQQCCGLIAAHHPSLRPNVGDDAFQQLSAEQSSADGLNGVANMLRIVQGALASAI